MCGICGFLKFDSPANSQDLTILEAMNDTLKHRGPDARDEVIFDNVALGFSRLSIIGLENGMQPIASEDGSIRLICNGEIFNYIELRKELELKGHSFSTKSDVEVIIHLYEDHGMEFLNRLIGQFAFVLHDRRSGKLFCARDQMGIVPLFYARKGNLFAFGSEVKAMLQHPELKAEVDMVGLDQILTFPGLISPRTMFKGINSLENGHYLVVDAAGTVSNREYWDLNYPKGVVELNGHSEEHYIDELEELFEESIRLRLRSDVPSGLYLSGGLDSSMITMKVRQMAPDQKKEAFSIDFIDSQHSEAFYQQLIAKESDYKLNPKTFFFNDISERLRLSIYHSECPIKETYNTASLSLSEAVRAKQMKVVLSGEGADEFFAGYVGYRFDKMRAMGLVKNPASDEEKELRERLWGDKDFFYERDFNEYEAFRKQLYSQEVVERFEEINCLGFPLVNKERLEGRSVLHKRAYIDYKLRLVDHLVSDHGDRMSLANSVEVRYPFLDKKLVEYSTRVPEALKLNDFTEKYILKRMASRFVPQQVFDREKFHFIAPGSPYLLQKKVEYIQDLLSYDQIKRQGFFNPDMVEELKTKYSEDGYTVNAPYESDVLITVITFGIFLDQFIEN